MEALWFYLFIYFKKKEFFISGRDEFLIEHARNLVCEVQLSYYMFSWNCFPVAEVLPGVKKKHQHTQI